MWDGSENVDQDLAAMKKLLVSWHVGILYELFKEEDITINELKMMQFSHVNVLLKDYKMGVRIRFEYHFNSWRNKIGIPLTKKQLNHNICCCDCNGNIGNSSIENYDNKNTGTISDNSEPKRKRLKINAGSTTNHAELNENHAPLSPQSVNSNNSFINLMNSNNIVNCKPMPLMGSPNENTHNTDEEAEMENIPLNTLSDLLSDAVYETPPKFPSKWTPDKCPVSLDKIMEMSGSRGRAILQFFKEQNRLTNIHRSQLIQTIVDFFVENDYHLSLNMSHHLEWEILKMFPTEKLEYYRTEKRGKMYVKFSNTKRYKRERNNRVKTEMQTVTSRPRRSQQIDGNNEKDSAGQEDSDNNMDGKADEDWYLPTEPEVMVKEENLSESENNRD